MYQQSHLLSILCKFATVAAQGDLLSYRKMNYSSQTADAATGLQPAPQEAPIFRWGRMSQHERIVRWAAVRFRAGNGESIRHRYVDHQ